MNKQHWITLHPGGGLDAGLVGDLVTESYLLVVENLPKGHQPRPMTGTAAAVGRYR